MQLKDKVVIITGAGGGIGGAIALNLAKKGAHLSLVDRGREGLAAIAEKCRKEGKGVNIIEVAGDITEEDDIRGIVDETCEKLGPIDVLINCAGIMVFKYIKDHTERDVYNTLMVNIYGTIRLSQTVLPAMIKRGSGRIVNIGSIFGSMSFPLFGIYSASKFAIHGFSEALRRELRGTGVGITYIAPRATRTSQAASFLEMAKKVGMNLDKPEIVAAKITVAIEKEKNELFIGRGEAIFARLNSIAPSFFDKPLAKKGDIMSKYL